MSYRRKGCHPRHQRTRKVENVLVLQGGGSLGAFGCGVFKGLTKSEFRPDIVAGTSIGAINGAIIAGCKSDYPEKALEDFWLELAESSYKIIPDLYVMNRFHSKKEEGQIKRVSSASINAVMFGVPKMFVPRWMRWWSEGFLGEKEFFEPWNWTFAYDHSPLEKTLDRYVDYSKLSPAGLKRKSSSQSAGTAANGQPDTPVRFIATVVNVLTSEPLVFDSAETEIKAKHLLASAAYPTYRFPWVALGDDTYGWDGALLSNTPLREVIDASPRNDKHVVIVENYPRQIDQLPSNATEITDRTRDILFSDKTMHNIKMSKLITRQIELIEYLYDYFENSTSSSTSEKDMSTTSKKHNAREISRIKREYERLVNNYGAEILSVIRIIKDRVSTPHLLKNADFSPQTVSQLITEGELKAVRQLKAFRKEYNTT